MVGIKSALLATAAGLVTVAGAQAADLPTRKAAPVQYVKICDAYGAGFFFIPGTDTCLRVGGLVLSQLSLANTPYRMQVQNFVATPTNIAAINAGGGLTPVNAWQPGSTRDAVAFSAVGRVDLDVRSQSPWGTVRAFARISSQFGSGQPANTGSLTITGLPGFVGNAPERETTILEKGFIQFAGITMGRIQSMFDFYADAIGYTPQRGSNATVNGLAYTLTLGGGFSATLSLENSPSRRTPSAAQIVFGVAKGTNPWITGLPANTLNGTRLPEIVGVLRLDQSWGAAQISGAAHPIREGVAASGLSFAAGPTPPAGDQFASINTMGFAVQGGLMFKLNMLAPGDQLWLQAAYAKGAVGYLTGNNLAFVQGVNTQSNYGIGPARLQAGSWWNGTADVDCIFTMAGTCDQSKGFAVTGAFKHYWTPTVSTGLTASYMAFFYSQNVLNPMPTAAMVNTGAVPFMVGQSNYRELRLAGNIAWNPIPNFEIGAGVEWGHGITSRPVGLAPDVALVAAGIPAFKGQGDAIKGNFRMSRGF